MKPGLARETWCLALACFFAIGSIAATAAEAKLEAQLVWGTNDKESPDPKHKPVEPSVKKRLGELPLKFTHYFEVNRKAFVLPAESSKRVDLSDKCSIEVKRQEDDSFEVSLIGKGAKVVKRTQPLPKGEMLVVGGNAPNETAWLVIVKRLE
jgi:hypothetical protein